MINNDPITKLIRRYCDLVNTENKKDNRQGLLVYVFSTAVITSMLAWKAPEKYMAIFGGVIGLCFCIHKFYMDRATLGKLSQQYYLFTKGDMTSTGLVDDRFLSMLAEDETIPKDIKILLAEQQQRNYGEIRWHNIFEARNVLLNIKTMKKIMKGEGAKKISAFRK